MEKTYGIREAGIKKIPLTKIFQDNMKEIKREVEHLCKLEHPNVVRYYHLVSILLRNLFIRKCYNILIYLLECIFINLLAGMYPFLFFYYPGSPTILDWPGWLVLVRIYQYTYTVTLYYFQQNIRTYVKKTDVHTNIQTDRQTDRHTDNQQNSQTENSDIYKDNAMQC